MTPEKTHAQSTNSSIDIDPENRVSAYAKAVIDGEIVAGPHVRAACRRHFADLKNGESRGIYFDIDAADKAFRFFEGILKLNGGQFEGKPFVLQPAQAFIIGSLFGWRRNDATRRFRRAYIEMGKGNGKSPLVGGIGLYGLIADKEPRAEIYAAASKKDQAMVLFRDARAMVQLSPDLNHLCHISGGDHQPNIAYERGGAFFRPIAREKGQSGPRPHMALCDEVHEHPSRDTMEMLERGFKFRRQPLLIMITNSGSDKTSVCWEEHHHAVKVAHNEMQDDNTFSYVCALDKEDDPLNNPECWIKANPLIGVTITEKYLSDVVAQARAIPGKRNTILRLHFCIWTDSHTLWMARELWEACEDHNFPFYVLNGEPCFAGLDLSSRRDLTALALVFPDADGSFDAFVEFWTPVETLTDREELDRVPYRLWRDEGYLIAVPGASIDYGWVVNRIGEINAIYDLKAIHYDRWKIEDLKRELNSAGLDDITMIECGQGFQGINPCVEAIEDAIMNGLLRVHYNPVLRWNVSSAVLEQDPAGNRKFTKKKATGRIDGVVALAMAMRATVAAENEESVYAERGLITIG